MRARPPGPPAPRPPGPGGAQWTRAAGEPVGDRGQVLDGAAGGVPWQPARPPPRARTPGRPAWGEVWARTARKGPPEDVRTLRREPGQRQGGSARAGRGARAVVRAAQRGFARKSWEHRVLTLCCLLLM